MDYVMRRRSTVGGALEMFSLLLPLRHVSFYLRQLDWFVYKQMYDVNNVVIILFSW